jgi:hypothetical protein
VPVLELWMVWFGIGAPVMELSSTGLSGRSFEKNRL